MSYHRSPKDSLLADKADYRGETNRGHRLEIWTCCKLCVSSYCLVLYGFCTIPKKRTYPRYLKGIKITRRFSPRTVRMVPAVSENLMLHFYSF